MNVHIQNCNNVTDGNISIDTDKLNIKYAHNGTGKTTASEAITACIQDESLAHLTPMAGFKKMVTRLPSKV
jgi:predicted ATP-binding protein involved in virulence